MRVAFLSTACLLMAGWLAWAATSVQAADEAKREGVIVQPGDPLTADELAGLLGVHVWKLDVTLPEGAKEVSLSLHQQAKGKESKRFDGGMTTRLTADGKSQLLIAIVPMGGGLSDAEKVRVTMVGFGMFASGTADNPLRGLGIGGPAGKPEGVGDGTFNLIGGYEGTVTSPVSQADMVIVLKIESE